MSQFSALIAQDSGLSRPYPRAQVPGNPLLRMDDDEHPGLGTQPGEPGFDMILVYVLFDNLSGRSPDVVLDDLRSPFDNYCLESGRVVDTECDPWITSQVGVFEAGPGCGNVKNLTRPVEPHRVQLRRAVFADSTEHGIAPLGQKAFDFFFG